MNSPQFEEYERRSAFADAKRLAASLAIKYKCETRVARDAAEWVILVPSDLVELLERDRNAYFRQREEDQEENLQDQEPEDEETLDMLARWEEEEYKEALAMLAEWEEEDYEQMAREEANGGEIECPKCSGFGKIPMAGVCPRCKGEGWI